MSDRIELAVQSILENEQITDGLDDDAAKEMIDWGISCAEMIVTDSETLGGDIDNAVEQRLKALRQMLNGIKHWALTRENLQSADHQKHWSEILTPAREVYDSSKIAIWENQAHNPINELTNAGSVNEFIRLLHEFFA